MVNLQTHKKNLRGIICLCLVFVCFISVVLPEPTVIIAEAQGFGRASLSQGQQNIVKRAYQMTDIKWTPKKDIVGWGGDIIYSSGKTYTGLPYGQPVYASYVPWETSLDGFIAATENKSSKIYTDFSSYNKIAPYYSVDCSAFVSWAWNLKSRQTTRGINKYATMISTSSVSEAQVGDCLNLAGVHVVLITDITYDSRGRISSIEISEATTNKKTFYCCQKTRYGEGGQYSLDYLERKYFGEGYILYRSKTRDNVSYTHSCAVPLEGDMCEKCKYGYDNLSCEHSFSGILTKSPSCTENGVKTYICSKCKDFYTEKIPSYGHSFKNGYCVNCGISDPAVKKSGDADGDGAVTASDARLVLRASVGLEALSGEARRLADINADNKISASDARLILRISVGLENYYILVT